MAVQAPDGLFFDAVVKTFGGTHALRGVSLRIARGEIVALLGENGAGKSTLIKVLGGIHAADSGRVLIDGHVYAHVPGSAHTRQPVAFIHQDLGLIEWMTIAENMAHAFGFPRRFGLIDWSAAEAAAADALAKVGCDFDPTTRVADLTRTEKSLVAIARALAVDCDFLVLDEPTASLPADEVDRLFSALRQLRQRGVGMIYVSHRLDEVFRLADRVAVLRDGDLVGVRDTAHTDPEELVTMIVGRRAGGVHRPEASVGTAALEVRDLEAGSAGPVGFDVRHGELVGLVGLRGAGHELISRALFGAQPHTGVIRVEGEVVELTSPRAAMRAGIGLIARDRLVESVAPTLSVGENVFLNPAATGHGMLRLRTPSAEAGESRRLGGAVGLRPNDPAMPIEALSGGNQQKVVVARWLATGRSVLIAEDPTAGVDVGAKADLYGLLFEALQRGLAVLIVSTDFEEVATICHRALVFSRGLVVAELKGVGLSTEGLIQAASAGDVASRAA